MKAKLCMAIVCGFLASGTLKAYDGVETRGQPAPQYPGQQNPPSPGQQTPPNPGQQTPSPGQQTPPSPGQQTPPSPGQQYPVPPTGSQCNPGPGMQEIPGKFLRQGGDLYAAMQLPAQQCAGTCLSQAQCAGATYHPQSQTCYLKSYNADRTLYSHPDWTSYVKVSNRFQDYAGAFLNRGHDLAAYRTADVGTCKAVCTCQTACSGYTYHAASQSCFLKNGNADKRPYPGYGWSSGVKS